MARIKRILPCLLVICLLWGLNSGPLHATAQEPGPTSNQFTQVDTVNTDWQIDQTIPDTYKLVAENDTFKLYVDQTTLGFKVVDQRSGYVWHSCLDKPAGDDRLNKSWAAFAKSGISIEYLDPKATNKRISITNSEHTIDVKSIDQGIQASVTFTDFGISVGVTLKLEPAGVRIEIPSASIQEANPDFKLGVLYVYPFLGATRGDSVPGYMFIPDGSGSLIRFSSTTKAKNMLYDKYYGVDMGMITALPWDWHTLPPYNVSIPVFGMVHGYKQNAFISIVEKGASYGEIQAHPAGIITNFNFLYSAFVYNESYFQATNKAGAGVTTIQQQTNQFDIKIHYRFLTKDDSDYVGMAKSYQQYLVEKGVLKKSSDQRGDIGIRLEFLGAEREKVLLWNRSLPITTVNQISDILKDLNIKNQDVIYYGWQPLGASSMPPRSLKLDGSLGNLTQLRSLAEKITSDGGKFYLYFAPQAALVDEGGYSPRNDLAMSITDKNLQGFVRDYTNYLNLNALNNRYTSLSKDVFSNSQAGLALDGIGSTLYSDFKTGHFLNREDAIQKYQQLLAENPGPTSLYMPNDYMFGFMKAYYDMPLADSGYLYTTDVVPFLQIVLAGYVPYYGPVMNFSSNSRQDLLRQVDYGVYPSYFLTHEQTAKLLNTQSNWIYTSSYLQWGQDIKQTYQWMNNLLQPVKGQEIVAREVIQPGVVATSYANGKQILINYTDQPYSSGGVTVDAQDAVIREVLP